MYDLPEAVVSKVKCGCQDGPVHLGLWFWRSVAMEVFISPSCSDGCFFQTVDGVPSVDKVTSHLCHVFVKVIELVADPSDSEELAVWYAILASVRMSRGVQ